MTVVTGGNLSTCPRMLKAADALHDAGYAVRVVSACHTPWAERADRDLRVRRTWSWSIVDYRRDSAPWRYWTSGARFHLTQRASQAVGARHVPWSVVSRAFGRVGCELARAALAEPADFYYGGTTGALTAVAEASSRARVGFGIDFEDLHSAEHSETTASGRLANQLAARVEERLIGRAAFVTTSSRPIADRYQALYGVRPLVVHNTFPLPRRAPSKPSNTGAPLKLYWFSQTIGPGRGLEDIIRAAGVAGFTGELHLRGQPSIGYDREIVGLASSAAPKMPVFFHDPVPPDAMIDSCRDYDIGLSLEVPDRLNHALCVGNKVMTYPLAGLAVIVTETPGHRSVMPDFHAGIRAYRPGAIAELALILTSWNADRDLLMRAKADAWAAARERWHWEHPDERGALVAQFASVGLQR